MKLNEALTKTREVIRRKHFSLATEECYCGWIRRFAAATKQMPANLTSEQRLERFLTDLAKQNVAASTQNQAFNAILFFYKEVVRRRLGNVQGLRARREATVRYAPSQDQARALLGEIKDLHGYPTRLIVRLIYGCGLRVSEPLNLRIKDVQIEESHLVIRSGKGGKDRVVALPCSLIPELEQQIRAARVMWERDARDRLPVTLPGRLEQKYPEARHSWQWYWLFPATKSCFHPRTAERVRWRCHEANVQRCVKQAAREIGLQALVTPHCLRHAYATHAMQQGAYVRDVQEAMGHVSLETTMGYLHSEAKRVASPLERLQIADCGLQIVGRVAA
jgi:integron integrase